MEVIVNTLMAGEWETIKTNVLRSRIGFDEEMFNTFFHNPINKKLVYDGAEGILELPIHVNIKERYRIHTYTIPHEIDPRSQGEGEARWMKIKFSNGYLREICDKYYVEEVDYQLVEIVPMVENVVPNFEEFKKNFLQDIMGLIEKHLNEEYLKFIS